MTILSFQYCAGNIMYSYIQNRKFIAMYMQDFASNLTNSSMQLIVYGVHDIHDMLIRMRRQQCTTPTKQTFKFSDT